MREKKPYNRGIAWLVHEIRVGKQPYMADTALMLLVRGILQFQPRR